MDQILELSEKDFKAAIRIMRSEDGKCICNECKARKYQK